MPRIARVVVPYFPHHVTQRGNRRQRTFFNRGDYEAYLDLMSEFCRKAGTRVWAYCLMPNHVHMVMVPSHVDGLREALGESHRRYTRRINFRNEWRGHLWQERFYSFPMDEAHLVATVRYVERNPVAAGLSRTAQDWLWSSARAHLSGRNDKLTDVPPMLDQIDDWAAFLAGTDDEELGKQISKHSRTGRPMGDERFVRTIERITGRELKCRRPGPEKRKEGR